MKLLIRGEKNFLEAELDKYDRPIPTGKEVDPETLTHLGTDIIGYTKPFDLRDRIETIGKNPEIDYLCISQNSVNVDYAQCGKDLVAVTAYREKRD